MTATINFLAPRYWLIWLLLGLLKLLVKLPYRWQLQFGRKLGQLLWLLPTKMKGTTLINLQLCFPELDAKARHQLARENFAAVGMGIMETALGWWAPEKKLSQLAHKIGFAAVEQALQRGQGVILCGAHFTSLELVGRLTAKYLPLAVVYRPQKNALLEKINRQALMRHYHTVLLRDDMRGVLRCLKNNICVWYTPDVDAGVRNSVFAPFFGVPAASVNATPRLAKISDAPLVPVAFYRRADLSGYDIIMQPPLVDFPSGHITEDVSRINSAIETAIRQKPEQYLWQYKRFKTRPEGEKRFY